MNAAKTIFRALCAAILLAAIFEVVWVRPARSADREVADKQEPAKADGETRGNGAEKEPAKNPSVAESVAQDLENRRTTLEERGRVLDDQERRLTERSKEIDVK